MRDEFVRTLTELASADPNLVLITGDLGFGVLTAFARQFPRQFVNAGVAEQNMTGLAVGLALEGKTVFTYSIGNFPTLRCLEQIRNDACYHEANVKIVAVGGGFSYGALGISHHATEDLAILRALPDMTVVAPGDPWETAAATRAIYATPGTCYLRLGRGGEPRVHGGPPDFHLGRPIEVIPGSEVVLVATGGILACAAAAARQLRSEGIDVGLFSLHTLKPIAAAAVRSIAAGAHLLVTIEEHSVTGGLGGAVAEIVAQMPEPRARLVILGLRDGISSVVGDQDHLRGVYGLRPGDIADAVKIALREEDRRPYQRP